MSGSTVSKVKERVGSLFPCRRLWRPGRVERCPPTWKKTPDPFAPAAFRRGFTLVEVTITAAIMTILLGGMASAILLASKAQPDTQSVPSAAMASSRATDLLSADVFHAVSIARATATELVFTVADRSGDGAPETIRYAWSGTPGDPLLRQVNGNTAATAASDVREFQLVYDKRQVALPTSYSDGAEVLLASNDSQINLYRVTVNSSSFSAQYFQPTLPANTKTWKVTRVRVRLAYHDWPWGQTAVQLRLANGVVPGDFVIEERPIMEYDLSWYPVWRECTFSNVSGLLPGNTLCLVLTGNSSYGTCEVQVQGVSGLEAGQYYVNSANGGTSWTAWPGLNMNYYVYGTVSTPDPVSYQYLLTGVRCTLRSGPDPGARIQTSIRIVNEPQVTGP